MHEARPRLRRDPPETRRCDPPMTKTVALPRSPPTGIPTAAIPLHLQLRALRHNARLDVAPQGDQELACHSDDRDPPGAARQHPDPLAEPGGQGTPRLVSEPQPRELDEGFARPGVPALPIRRSRFIAPLWCGMG